MAQFNQLLMTPGVYMSTSRWADSTWVGLQELAVDMMAVTSWLLLRKVQS